jgi:hypothetical protein
MVSLRGREADTRRNKMFKGTGTGARSLMRPSVYKLLGLGGVLAGVSLAAAGPASAAPCTPTGTTTCAPLSFNNAVLDTPSTPNQAVVTPSGTPITATAAVTPTSATAATFSIDPTDWSFPTYNFDIGGVTGTIDVKLKTNDPATGTLNAADGSLQMTADLVATVTPTGGGSAAACTIDTGPLSFSTAATKPLEGFAFPSGTLAQGYFVTGAGAFGASWSSLPAGTPASNCGLVDAALGGPGGLWISRNISPAQATPPPPPAAPVAGIKVAKLKTLKAGHKETVKVTVTNTGGSTATPTGTLTACLTAPKQFKPRSSCRTISSLAAGKSQQVNFRIKASRKAHGTYKLKLAVTGSSISTAKKTIRLKVKK